MFGDQPLFEQGRVEREARTAAHIVVVHAAFARGHERSEFRRTRIGIRAFTRGQLADVRVEQQALAGVRQHKLGESARAGRIGAVLHACHMARVERGMRGVLEAHRLAVGDGRGDEEIDADAKRNTTARDFIGDEGRARIDEHRIACDRAPQGPARVPAVGLQDQIDDGRRKADARRNRQRDLVGPARIGERIPIGRHAQAAAFERARVDDETVARHFGRGITALRIGNLGAAQTLNQAAAIDLERRERAFGRERGESARRRAPVHIDAMVGFAQPGQDVHGHAPDELQAVFRMRTLEGALEHRERFGLITRHDDHGRGRAREGMPRRQGGGSERRAQTSEQAAAHGARPSHIECSHGQSPQKR